MNRFCFAGLGNPGSRYEHNRHNVGFCAADALRLRLRGSEWQNWKDVAQSSVCRLRKRGDEVRLFKPQNYMNCSGLAIGMACRFLRIEFDHIMIIHDELDLELGDIRLKFGGGTAGHRGVTDCASVLGTPDFWRLRIGIGRPVYHTVSSYVLSDFTDTERQKVEQVISFIDHAVPKLFDHQKSFGPKAVQTFQADRAQFLATCSG